MRSSSLGELSLYRGLKIHKLLLLHMHTDQADRETAKNDENLALLQYVKNFHRVRVPC